MALPLFILGHVAVRRRPATVPAAGFADDRFAYRSGGGHRALAGAMALLVAGGVGTVLVTALVAPDILPRVGGELEATNIVIPLPPEPQVQEQTERSAPDPVTESRITLPRTPEFPPVSDAGPVVAVGTEIPVGDPFPMVGAGAAGGGGTVTGPPAPLFHAAQRDPRFAAQFQPPYPPAMERMEQEGRARVRVTISASGRVVAIEDAGSSDPAFFNATRRQALSRWRFTPATRDGVPVESVQELTVVFRIPR